MILSRSAARVIRTFENDKAGAAKTPRPLVSESVKALADDLHVHHVEAGGGEADGVGCALRQV